MTSKAPVNSAVRFDFNGSSDAGLVAEYEDDGVAFAIHANEGTERLGKYLTSDRGAEAASLLWQLEEEGYCSWRDGAIFLPWESIFELIDIAEYSDLHQILGFPPIEKWRSVLESSGAFSDDDFSIFISSWISPATGRREEDVRVRGAVIKDNGRLAMVGRPVWEILRLVRAFHSRTPRSRTADNNRRIWAELRKHAINAGADLGDFLRHTVVITPERLRLELRRGDINASDLVEVIPTFEGAPRRWIEIFDRSTDVPTRYDVPDHEGLTQILVPDQTANVLREIKRMPGRRIVGERAESFVRNPFAVLGPDANDVLDPAQFEQARQDAGLSLTDSPRA